MRSRPPTQPRHVVSIFEAPEAGSHAITASWDYTRTLMPRRALRKAAISTMGTAAIVTGALEQWTQEAVSPSWWLGLPAGTQGLRITYYELKKFHEEWVTQERLRHEIDRLKMQPTIFTRVCERCEGTTFDFIDEPHNPLSRRVHRRCTRCGSADTKVTNGKNPGMFYNGSQLTAHMSFFGATEGKLILGFNTVWGLGTEGEEKTIKQLLLG